MKKLIISILVISNSIASCKTESQKVGFMCYTDSESFWVNNRKCFVERSKQLGIEIIEKYCHNDENLQYDQAIELMNQGVKVIVIVPVNANTAAAIVREAKKRNVKIIAYDRMIHNCDLDYYVSVDSKKIGELMAKEAIKQKPEGTYLLLWGDKRDDNADLVKAGILKILQPLIDNKNIKVLYQNYIEDWSLKNAEHEVEKITDLSCNEKIDAIVSSYDGMTRGAINALKRQHLFNDVFSSGQNAEIESLNSILKDEQTITVYKSPKTSGYATAELAAKLITNNSQKLIFDVNGSMFNGYKQVPSILLDPSLVNKLNMESVVFAEGIIDKKELTQ
jgi:D-xylose ABC transporter substrate-binding protein